MSVSNISMFSADGGLMGILFDVFFLNLHCLIVGAGLVV